MAMTEASILFFRTCLALLAMPIYLLSFLGIWEPFCKKIFFPFFLEKLTAIHNRKTKKQKQELFRNLPDFAGPSGELKLLEIGTGCGANFQFYPPGCKVTCTDINPNFQQGLSRSMSQNQHIHYERFLTAAGEDLHQVPSGSVDAVVCTLVLCSVQSVNSTLKEVLRVLRPGGVFYFLEHVADDHSSWRYFWQQVCYPTWKLVFAGCCLTREIWKNLEQANFSELKLQHISVPLPGTPIKPHIIGYAVK
ncbi:putative methyltransferase-like protein 7A [Cygnus atratus]|uniref:putative methyltransferase-like protein 7A n=1 Tax=Cygnus atratus TaxID=8868 RepID=UPI0015D5D820|nr:putative methyltransferase-like protein 7A [Cygnus atratus]